MQSSPKAGHCPSPEGTCWGAGGLIVQVAVTKIPQLGALQQQTLMALGSRGFRSGEIRVLTDLVSGETLLPGLQMVLPSVLSLPTAKGAEICGGGERGGGWWRMEREYRGQWGRGEGEICVFFEGR